MAGYRGWKYEKPFDVPMTLIAGTGGGKQARVLLQGGDGNLYDCGLADKRGPRMSYPSSSSCAGDCEEDSRDRKRQRSRAPNERGIGVYGSIPEGDEIKYIDNRTGAEEAISATPIRITLNAIKTGDQFYERVGHKITMKDIEIWYRISLNYNGLARKDVIRLLVLYDRSPTDADGKGHLPEKETVISSYDAQGSTSSTSEDNINPTQIRRFLVLKDYKIYLSTDGSGIDQDAQNGEMCGIDRSAKIADRFLIDLHGLVSYYRPHEAPEANPSIRQITTGSLLLYVFGLHPEDDGWNLHYNARLRYSDA